MKVQSAKYTNNNDINQGLKFEMSSVSDWFFMQTQLKKFYVNNEQSSMSATTSSDGPTFFNVREWIRTQN